MLAEFQAPAKPRWTLREPTLAQVESMFMLLMNLDEEEDDDSIFITVPSDRDAD